MSKADAQHWTVGKALAEHVGIPRTTLQSAVTQGRIPSRTFGCGSLVVNIRDVKAWAKLQELEAKHAGSIIWAKLQQTKRLTESDIQEFWTRGTWKTYKCKLVKLGWCRNCDDGSIAWIGPKNITFTDFQQKRHEGISGKK